jgi:MFS family permease
VIVFVLIFGLILTVMPIYAQDRFGVGASGRGVLLGLPAVTSTVFALNLARIQGRFGRRRVLIVAPALFAVALGIIAWAPTIGYLALGALVFGAGEGILIPGLQDVASSVAPASSRGTTVAVWVGGARAGQTIGPLVAAASLGAIGAQATFASGAAAAAALVVVLAVGARRVRARAAPGPSPFGTEV